MKTCLAGLVLGFAAVTAPATEPLPLPSMGSPQYDGEYKFEFALIPKAFQKNPRIEMTVFCELTDYGRTLPEVTPQNPAYYIARDSGLQEFGLSVGGSHPPDAKYLEKVVQRALSGNGYLPAGPGERRPTLVLFLSWGCYYSFDHEDRLKFPELALHHDLERSLLVGGQKYERNFAGLYSGLPTLYRSQKQEFMDYQARNDLYFVVVSAYDHDALAHGQRRLVWRARMTANTRGVAMDETLPPLVLTAGPYFGRDMKEAEAVTRPVRRGVVTLGPLEVVEQNVQTGAKP